MTKTATATSNKVEPIDRVRAYCEAVLAGTEVAGPHVRAACRRHLRDLEHGAERGIYWHYPAAEYVFGFFRKCLSLSDGQFEGLPFELHQSQAFILGSIFGWKRGEPNQVYTRDQLDALPRRYQRAYIEQGKGNGKSPMIGGVGLFGMMADGEPGAQIYAAASDKDQARILFDDAVKMAQRSRAFNKDGRIKYSGQEPNIWNMAALKRPQNGSFFRPLSREKGRKGSGPRPHFALCDEVHEHPDRSMMEMLERGFKFRRQPLLLMITNSGTDRNSICYEEHDLAIKVAHGDLEDDRFFSYVCALDEGDDPLADRTCWKKANPLLGVTLTEEYLAGVCKQAIDAPGKQNGILRLHFCVWTNAQSAWLSRPVLDKCIDPTLRLEDFEGKDAFVGLDLSSTKDLSAKVLTFIEGWTEQTVDENTGAEIAPKPKFVVFAHGYTPEQTLADREKADKAPYSQWVKDKHITATPGPVVRFDYLVHDLAQDQQRFNLCAVAYDRHNIKRFELDMSDAGVDLPLHEHGQTFAQKIGKDRNGNDQPLLWMPQAVETFENAALEGRLRIAPNPALVSAIESARFVHSPGGTQRRFDKITPGGRIDLCVAAAMSVNAADVLQGEQMNYVEGSLMVAA